MIETESVRFPPPLPPYLETVRAEWVDYNGHMNVAYYVLIFDRASDGLLDAIGIDEPYRLSQQKSLFVVEAHVAYLRELRAGDPVRVETQILGYDNKRLHAFLRMVHGESGELAATYEIVGLHVDMTSRRAAPFPEPVRARIRAISAMHASLLRPSEAGRGIALSPRR